MKAENQHLTAEESLNLITRMIKQAKGNVRANSIYFLLWGWIVSFASLGMYIFMKLDFERPWLVWSITIPAWIWTIYISYNRGKRESNPSHFDRIATSLWFGYGVTILTLVFFQSKINFQLMPLILITTSIPTFVSGVMVRLKSLIFGGLVFWISGIICFLVPYDLQYLIGAIAIMLGYLIPGYSIRSMKE